MDYLTYIHFIIQRGNMENNILLPLQAEKVHGVAHPVIDLNSSVSGTWKFLLESPKCIPLPNAANQDFDFNQLSGREWKPVFVPGELSIQGFNILNNTEYYYQRKIDIPNDYNGNRILIRFDGVYTNARVWIDGRYIRTHKGGFVAWDCDITDYVKAGTTITLTVGVAYIFGPDRGTWNNTGEDIADPSGASFYANHNIGGINRDVALMALPKNYIADIITKTEFDDAYNDVDLKVSVRLGMHASCAQVKLELLDKNGSQAACGLLNFKDPQNIPGISSEEETIIHVKSPQKWDAEHPYLYTLKAIVTAENIETEITALKSVLQGMETGESLQSLCPCSA